MKSSYEGPSPVHLLIAGSLIVLGCCVYIYYLPDVSVVHKLQLVFASLAGFSIVIIAYNSYLTSIIKDKIADNRFLYNTLDNIERNWLKPQEDLIKAYPEGYFLYAEMNPDTPLDKTQPQTFDKMKREQLEIVYSNKVFQCCEDFLSTVQYDIVKDYVWINKFVMWFQSPTLQKNWRMLNFNYSARAREFIDKIIVMSGEIDAIRKKNGVVTSADYDSISKRFDVSVYA